MLRKLLTYLFSKKNEIKKEIKDMNRIYFYLTLFIIFAELNKKKSEFLMIPLNKIKKMHVIDNDFAISKLNERMAVLEKSKIEIIDKRNINKEFIAKNLPSLSWIKSIGEINDYYIIFDGNGRVEAFNKVFGSNFDLNIEIEIYEFRSGKKLQEMAKMIMKKIELIQKHER